MADEVAGPPQLTWRSDGVAVITLQRPRHANRLHREDLQALHGHFATLRQAAESGQARVLVLAAEGRVFCSGFNLEELGQADAAGADPQAFERVCDALEALPLVTVARLQGGVYGGATDLALACDFRIGVDHLELRMPAARLGLHYYPSGLRRYVARLGLNAAKRLFLQGEAVPASDLLRMGYLDDAVPAEQLDARVEAVVAALRAGAPLALAGMKASLDEIARGDWDEARIRTREARCAASQDLAEGLAAQREKRTPRFTGG